MLEDIRNYAPLNEVDAKKVASIKASIVANGYVGTKIYFSRDNGLLLTGSHRFVALMELLAEDDDRWFDLDCCEAVEYDELQEWIEEADVCGIDSQFYDWLQENKN